jgi:hypothetical protein
MKHRHAAAATVAALALAGCAGKVGVSVPLGRSIAAAPPGSLVAVAPARAPVGDPPAERAGTISATAQTAEDWVSRAGVASSPRLALRRYALAYINWQADDLDARERQLATMSVGAARLVAEQTAAARSGVATLAANDVANSGQVVAIVPGEGPDAGQWLVVTQEHTTGTGPYAGLPAGPHVTLAQVRDLKGGWAVSAWNPAS